MNETSKTLSDLLAEKPEQKTQEVAKQERREYQNHLKHVISVVVGYVFLIGVSGLVAQTTTEYVLLVLATIGIGGFVWLSAQRTLHGFPPIFGVVIVGGTVVGFILLGVMWHLAGYL